MHEASQRELGEFLRSRREKTTVPIGPATRNRRRTPGLRRSEVAELAGISVDWYTRLEQGRTVSPSSTTIDALARVLQLSEAEHSHVQQLARKPIRPRWSLEVVPDALRRLVQGLNQPAYVTGRRLDVLAWNSAASEIFGDLEAVPVEDRNILIYGLTDPAARRLFGPGWSVEAKAMVDKFRATYDLWATDPAFASLVDRLKRSSPEFSIWWASRDIASNASCNKWLMNATGDLLHFECVSLQANDNPALKLAVYTQLDAN